MKQYFACDECYDVVRTDIIPKDNFNTGLISNYKYYGTDTEWILSCSAGSLSYRTAQRSTVIIKYNDIDTQVSLTCCYRPQYIVINKLDGIGKHEEGVPAPVIEYFIPVFFKKRVKHRNTAVISHYNLENLYKENPGIIGYYEIDVQAFHLSDEEMQMINVHNNNLFKMALENNMMASTVMDLSKDNACYFTFLPIELLHIIIKFVLKS